MDDIRIGEEAAGCLWGKWHKLPKETQRKLRRYLMTLDGGEFRECKDALNHASKCKCVYSEDEHGAALKLIKEFQETAESLILKANQGREISPADQLLGILHGLVVRAEEIVNE